MSDKHEATYHGADDEQRAAVREAAERAAERVARQAYIDRQNLMRALAKKAALA